MKCKKCGTEIEKKTTICPACGEQNIEDKIDIYNLWSNPDVPEEFKNRMQMEGISAVLLFFSAIIMVISKNIMFGKVATIVLLLLVVDFIRFYYYTVTKSWVYIEGICVYMERHKVPFTSIKNPVSYANDVILECADGTQYLYQIKGKTKCKLHSEMKLYVSKNSIVNNRGENVIQGVIMASYKDGKQEEQDHRNFESRFRIFRSKND